MVDEHGETPHRNDQELHPEAVVVAVIGGPELDVDQVDRGVRTADVDHLRGADDREGLVTVRWRERCRGGASSQLRGCSRRPHLHACVVQGDERSEQIQVACGEHYGEQDLALPGDTWREKDSKRVQPLRMLERLQTGVKRFSLMNSDIYWKHAEYSSGKSEISRSSYRIRLE